MKVCIAYSRELMASASPNDGDGEAEGDGDGDGGGPGDVHPASTYPASIDATITPASRTSQPWRFINAPT
ncbi:hypothetical protein [Paenarthrobacter sp. C1]|uniref:hypothetical protein n=1 Tax=Paenarthrobacter sp. C1 TaxID=3400220 RepID=UPI003BF551E2